MKRLLVRLGAMFGAIALLIVVSAGPAYAANALCPPNAPAEIKNSEVCKNQSDPIGGPGGLISDVTTIVSVVAGIIAVVMIMYAGYQFITAGSDSNKAQEAKKTVLWSAAGLVVIVVARSIIVFVVNRL